MTSKKLTPETPWIYDWAKYRAISYIGDLLEFNNRPVFSKKTNSWRLYGYKDSFCFKIAGYGFDSLDIKNSLEKRVENATKENKRSKNSRLNNKKEFSPVMENHWKSLNEQVQTEVAELIFGVGRKMLTPQQLLVVDRIMSSMKGLKELRGYAKLYLKYLEGSRKQS